MDYKGIVNERLEASKAEVERLEIEQAKIENDLRFEMARVSVYKELAFEFDTEGATLGETDEIVDLDENSLTDTSYSV